MKSRMKSTLFPHVLLVSILSFPALSSAHNHSAKEHGMKIDNQSTVMALGMMMQNQSTMSMMGPFAIMQRPDNLETKQDKSQEKLR